MIIEQLKLINFRNFQRSEWEFGTQVNLLVGDNGSGKTTILDAMAFGLGAFTGALGETFPRETRARLLRRGNEIKSALYDSVRVEVYERGGIPTREPQFPLVAILEGRINSQHILWARTYNITQTDSVQPGVSPEITTVGRQFRHDVKEGKDVILPLIAYYGCRRLCSSEDRIFPTFSSSRQGSRLDGYNNCLEANINQRDFLQWFQRLEFAAIQRNEKFEVLEGVRQAIIDCTEDATNVSFDSLENELVFNFKNGSMVPFRLLSDGYRNIISLIADIAYRASVLNPHFEKDAPKNTPGVVLIDEIDLHLHPTWQRIIIGKIIQTFPKIQFILTTHAPLIIQSLEVSGQARLINLDPGLSTEFRHKSPEEIYTDNQGIENIERSAKFHEMVAAAAEYYLALDKIDQSSSIEIDKLKLRLDELMLPYSDEPAYVAFLEMHREANPKTARSTDASH